VALGAQGSTRVMLAPSVAFIDLETTGTSPARERVTEIAIVRMIEGEVVEEWSSLVNPECSIPEAIQALTGITNDMVRGAPTFGELRREILERLEGSLFVAHNARFDYGFMKHEFGRLDMAFKAEVLCTVRLSRRLFPEAIGHGLDAIVARHGLHDAFAADPFTRGGRHSALGDARVLRRFVELLYRVKGEEEIDAAVKRILKIPSLPPQLPPDALENLPEGPGVYRFYGVNDLPIYVGKSINLRERVRSHFSSDYRSANDLRISSEIRRIECEEAAGELGALLREAELVKTSLPLHNHRLRKKETACFVQMEDFAAPPEMLLVRDIDWNERGPGSPPLYGPFTSKVHVRAMLEDLAREHGLCWRQLGWEKRGGPCFFRQVRKCRGACIGEETPQVHGLRLVTALGAHKLRDWPWPGRAVVRERHPGTGREAAYVFDRWHHVGTARDERELEDLLACRVDIGFDPDVYRILVQHLGKAARPAAILPKEPELTGS
jgi:DNA polymerase III subunit epsilon